MPKNRKYFLHNTAILVTSRIEEGLPLVPTHFLNEIIWGILARAKQMYQVKVCHFVFMANHFHMLLVVENPEDISNFTGYVKAEIAHSINRLLGRKQKTVWTKGYDSPILLTYKDVLRYIDYIYLNPSKANLVNSIGDYPGVSSWEIFSDETNIRDCKHVSRDSIRQLSCASLSINEQKKLLAKLLSNHTKGCKLKFILEPYAWMKCFTESKGQSIDQIKNKIFSSIKKSEEQLAKKRKESEKTLVGPTSLRRQSMLKEYNPKQFSKRMICISSDIPLRKRFISYFKELSSYASKVYNLWKKGLLELRIPPGILAPRVPVLVSSLTSFT